LLSSSKNFRDMMNGKKLAPLMTVLVILVILSTGCTGTRPAAHMTDVPAGTTFVTTTTPVTLPAPGTVSVQEQQPITFSTPMATRETVVTQTIKERPLPTTSSVRIYNDHIHVDPLSFDRAGVITSGNLDISGTIESDTGYPVWVDLRADVYDAFSLNVPKATAYDTVRMFPYGTSTATFRIPNYVFNDRPDYATTFDTYKLTIVKVTVIPS